MSIFTNLNDMQKKAVETTEGPLLILAGAGSGKTTVLVSRLAYILSEKNISPYRVLAITFTNKAANEMKERVKAIIGGVADQMWIGTFHSMCVRILRSTIDLIGFGGDFVIYDTNDTKAIIRDCLKELNIDEKKFPIKMVSNAISRAKDDMLTPELFEARYKNDFRMSIISKAYYLYQKKLKKNNAVDFDDIILHTIRVLSENEDVLQKYQEKFQYIMVDEYQDTNNAQYVLCSLLAGKYKNICVVGDDDQSIYKFRGANIRNILDFEKEFNDCVTIKLEQNYRSTENILNAANAVIANNTERKGKKLWTDLGKGEKIVIKRTMNEHEEALYIAREVKKHIEGGGTYSDCAILYRMNAQSRVLEEMFMRQNVPYRVLAGLRFYDRKEIKDMLAYLRVVYNEGDDVSLKRIVNEPKRGIGQTTIDKAQKIADDNNISIFRVFSEAEKYSELKRALPKIMEFVGIMQMLMSLKNTLSLSELTERIMKDTGYADMVKLISDNDGTSRFENLNELLSVVREFEQSPENEGENKIADFLERVALVSDVDNYDATQDSVVMMTMHSAKGLEFPVVFLPGFENGIFPGTASIGDDEEMQEERRLCYVAITRAKRKLYITNAECRMIFGKTAYQPESLFVRELPSDCIESEKKKTSVAGYFNKLGLDKKPNNVAPNWRKTEVNTPKQKFSEGDMVTHPKFGDGKVISAVSFGDDCKVEVIFEEHGRKVLMSNFAKLEKK